MSIQETVRIFIRKNKLHATAEDKRTRNYTHLDLSGGVLNIPEHLNQKFLTAYSHDITRGETHFFVEMKTEVFKMFFDVDLKIKREFMPTTTEIFKISRDIVRGVMRYYVTDNLRDDEKRDLFRTVVASTSDKDLDDDFVKIGFHIHFINVLVNKEQALLIHAGVCSALNKCYRLKSVTQPWEEILDTCVYEANGLRLIESDKTSACKVCNNKRSLKENCTECNQTGKVEENRPYTPFFSIDGNGAPDNDFTEFLKSNQCEMIDLLSIRSFAKKPNELFHRYIGAPSYHDIEVKRNKVSKTKHVTKMKRVKDLGDDGKVFKSMNKNKKPITDKKVYDALIKAIRISLPKVYVNLEIKDATYTDRSKTSIWVRVCGEGCNYCQNVQRDHTSNTIYFVVTEGGIAQRCFSVKNASCKTYCSIMMPINTNLLDIIFNNTTQQKHTRTVLNVYNKDTLEQELLTISKLALKYENDLFKNCSDETSESEWNHRTKANVKQYETDF